MASLQCTNCNNSIRYHGEPRGIEFTMISMENWERIISSVFNPEMKEYLDGTRCPKLYRTDTLENDFPEAIIKYWKCDKCGAIMFFNEQNEIDEIYIEHVSIEENVSGGKEYIVFDDYKWDEITESALPVTTLQGKVLGNKCILLDKKYILIKDDKGNIEGVYANKIIIDDYTELVGQD